jgi:hypothetical protein
MASHHTKDKGDLGVAKAHADLAAQGYVVLFPATEHAPFDLVAYRDDVFRRIQVKYRAARAGTITVYLRSVWADRNGTHTKAMDKAAIDVVCIYCPDTDECYYLRPRDHGGSVTIRIAPSRNGQRIGVLPAASFRNMPTFGPVVAVKPPPTAVAGSDATTHAPFAPADETSGVSVVARTLSG